MTEQNIKDEIYTAMTNGEWEKAYTLREDVSEEEYQNAYARYQADHEIPEEEREQNVVEAVQIENEQAREVELEVDSPNDSATEE